mgnify:CR=1 FL=1
MLKPPDDDQFLCQHAMELTAMISFVRGANSILEIGSRYGQTLLHLASNANPTARIVTVDIGDCPDKLKDKGIQTHLWWDEACDELRKTRDLHQIYGDSHNPDTVERVRALGPYDFVMIDGDHSLGGCRADWDNYGQMGRMVVFHDTRCVPDVAQVFQYARYGKLSIELTALNGYGIGVIYNG